MREASATIHSKYLAPHEVDFIQGRIGLIVFMRHYYNPAYITDLRERVFKAQQEIKNNSFPSWFARQMKENNL